MSTATSTAPRSRATRSEAAHRPRVAGPGGDLRLTRRGRLVVVLVFLAVLLGAILALGGYSAASDASSARGPARTVVVSEGDTLWEIASRAADGRDVREVVHELEDLNALSGPELVEGQRLTVPTR